MQIKYIMAPTLEKLVYTRGRVKELETMRILRILKYSNFRKWEFGKEI
jgi:hypothetical protein